MKASNIKRSATLIAALAVAAPAAQAALVEITTIGTGSTTINWTNVGGAGAPAVEGARVEANMVNNSGMSIGGGGQWVSHGNSDATFSNLLQQTGGLIIDLGATYELALMQIWNFNPTVFAPAVSFGPNAFDFYFTTNANAVTLTGGITLNVADLGLFTSLTDNTSLASAPVTSTYLGETYTFGSPTVPAVIGDHSGGIQSLSGGTITARYIFLDDLDGSGDFGGRMGFSELKFYAVPEPSAALLGGLGMLALLRRRR